MSEHTALTNDLYQLTMAQAYMRNGMHLSRASFEYFFRRNAFGGGYTVVAGVQSLLDYVRDNFRFTDEDIEYLKSLDRFADWFLSYLRRFRFSGRIWAMAEGSLAFPDEPVIRVDAPILEAQLLETPLLNIMNFQSLIATKAARIRHAAGDDTIIEFGVRRAQGHDGALSASRAAYIGGCNATSNLEAGREFGIPVVGTHSHSWVMANPNELTAFKNYADTFPDDTVLLVDTYDTLNSGLPHAIMTAKHLREKCYELKGIRLDSGDLYALSCAARKMLDDAKFHNVTICASNELDEHEITRLKSLGAPIDIWGVGTRLATGAPDAALGGVYKLVATQRLHHVEWNGCEKHSEGKATRPHRKQVWRFYDERGKMLCDVVDRYKPVNQVGPPDPLYLKRPAHPQGPGERMLLPSGTSYQHHEGDNSLLKSIRDRSARAQALLPDCYRDLLAANVPTYPVYHSIPGRS